MFGKKKTQIIRLGQDMCHSSVDDNEILFIRVDDVVRDADALVEVGPTYKALVIKGGGDLRYYNSGTHNVFDDKKEIKNWKSGLSVEVVYFPVDTEVPILWGTPERATYRDKASNKVITIGARGEFTVSVSNPEMFYRKVVGGKKEFNLTEFKKRFGNTVSGEFNDIFLRIVEERNLSYDQFSAKQKEIARNMEEILNPEFNSKWGLKVSNFNIIKIDLRDDETRAIETAAAEKAAEEQRREKMQEYLDNLERLQDKEWEREKYLRQLELQDKAAYYEVLKIVGRTDASAPARAPKLHCPVCGKEYSSADKFCPACGKRVSTDPIVCPDCGRVNESTAAFCANCGKKL